MRINGYYTFGIELDSFRTSGLAQGTLHCVVQCGTGMARYCESSLLCYRSAVYPWPLPFLTHFTWFVRSSGHSCLLGTQPLNPKSAWSELRAHRLYHSANSTYMWVLKWSFCGLKEVLEGLILNLVQSLGRNAFIPCHVIPFAFCYPPVIYFSWSDWQTMAIYNHPLSTLAAVKPGEIDVAFWSQWTFAFRGQSPQLKEWKPGSREIIVSYLPPAGLFGCMLSFYFHFIFTMCQLPTFPKDHSITNNANNIQLFQPTREALALSREIPCA